MKKPLKIIALDFDGTLVESNNIKDQAFETIFREWPEHREAIMQWHLASNALDRREKFRYFVEEVLGEIGNLNKINELTNRFSSLTREAIIHCPWVAGAREFLETFKKKIPLYLVSATPSHELEIIITQRQINKVFKAVFGSPLDKKFILQNIINMEKISTREIVYIGDSPEDQASAEYLGIDFIGVDSGRGIDNNNLFSDFFHIINHFNKIYVY